MKEVTDLRNHLFRLQMKYDHEHLNTVHLQNELAMLRQAAGKPAVDPWTSQVTSLKKTIADREKVINVYNAEIV